MVKARSKYEQRLQRRCSLREDYERAIAYEASLLKQVRQRATGKSKTDSVIKSLIGGMVGIYRRALKKFNGSLDLWHSFLVFLEANCGRKLIAEAHAQVIQLHPAEPRVWEWSADWEWKRGNLEGARTLYQRALRLLPNNVQVWEAFARMELQLVRLGHDPEVAKLVIQHAAQNGVQVDCLLQEMILGVSDVEEAIKKHFQL